MKTVKRFLICALAAVLFVGTAGCGAGGEHNATTDVQIYYWNAGYRLEFMQEIVDNFNAKQDEYTAYLDFNSDATTITSTLSLGEDNTYDLYFTMLNNMMYKPDFITLDDVLTLKPDGEDKTISLSDEVSMEMVWVKAGTFEMSAQDGQNADDEVPHSVTLKRNFYIGRTEVTQAQWSAVMGSNPSYFRVEKERPVEQVSWYEAMEFC